MESQNIEYKQVWKDDYLKWICGFANAQGGTIFNGELLIIFYFSKEYQNAITNTKGSIVENIVENQRYIVENIIEKLPKTQSQIIRIILEDPSVTTKEIAGTLSIAQRNVQNHIRKLKEVGVIRRVGPDKGGRWEIII